MMVTVADKDTMIHQSHYIYQVTIFLCNRLLYQSWQPCFPPPWTIGTTYQDCLTSSTHPMIATRVTWCMVGTRDWFSGFEIRQPVLLFLNTFFPEWLSMKSAYQVLGVARTASRKEIKKKYIELCKKHHPDVASRDARVDIRDINAAYRQLMHKGPERATPTYETMHKSASAEEQQEWTKKSLYAGLGIVSAVVLYILYEEPSFANLPAYDTSTAPWQPQNHQNYRQWRKQ